MKTPSYPDWAPGVLVEEYFLRTTQTAQQREVDDFDPEELVNRFSMSEGLLRGLYFQAQILPEREGTPLLGKLITDLRMKAVWAAIKKRSNDEEEFVRFWRACESGIMGWRKDQKLTPSERKDFLIRVHKLAAELSEMMMDSEMFAGYSVSKFIDKDDVREYKGLLTPLLPEEFRDSLNDWNALKEDILLDYLLDYIQRIVSITTPGVDSVLSYLSSEALHLSKEEALVKKPNSDNAPVHYFIRKLSKYCRETYGQPLNDAVAATTAVIFDHEAIDSDYVRKLL